MEEKKSTVYVALDGKEFTNKKDAESYEEYLKHIKYYEVYEGADLTEGRNWYRNTLHITVTALNSHDLFLENYLYETYGNRIAFVQGFKGSNAIVENWLYTEITREEFVEHTRGYKPDVTILDEYLKL